MVVNTQRKSRYYNSLSQLLFDDMKLIYYKVKIPLKKYKYINEATLLTEYLSNGYTAGTMAKYVIQGL